MTNDATKQMSYKLTRGAIGTVFVASLFAFLTTFGIATPAHAKQSVPKFTNHVVDDANALTDAVEQQVNADLADYQQRTTNQIAILIVKTTEPQSIEDYAVDVGNAWGVGTKTKDNGVLMILAMDDHKGRIEVGYGLQGELTDLKSRDILDTQVFPRLKQNDPGEAVLAGEQAIRASLGDPQANQPAPMARPAQKKHSGGFPYYALIPVALLLLNILSRGGRRGGGSGLWILPTMFGSGGFGGSSSGGGFSGGGFGGGGGGSFGGGGSSGSW